MLQPGRLLSAFPVTFECKTTFFRDPSQVSWHRAYVTTTEAIKLLEKFRAGGVSREKVLHAFQAAPVADLGFAQVDTHRALRKGFPEVIFGAGKTPEQVVKIAGKLLEREKGILITRINGEHVRALRKKFKQAKHHPEARCVTIEKEPLAKRPGIIAVVCAGTSDLPVAEEAAVTAEVMGNRVERIRDVGVAGLHRLFAQLETIQSANVIIVVAGMEGALPSVVAGLVSKPVIAVPTSVGYGASFGGLAALLGMLNSCGSGVTVVNIDNGFGAGYAASQINALVEQGAEAKVSSSRPTRKI
ncbi:MAG: 1-(5-phosphoribosyl)-5-amino-4-imidazole-carboxylate carboxylase [Pedosphaera sp.]|nr:1-(5-phosphoribosyl)-5-amino-4-imidazole-carboxylate carboxylase [Pedosphaera sp.]